MFAKDHPKVFVPVYAAFCSTALFGGFALIHLSGFDTLGLVNSIVTEFPSIHKAYTSLSGAPDGAIAQMFARDPKVSADFAITAVSQLLISSSYPYFSARIAQKIVERKEEREEAAALAKAGSV